MAMRLLRHYLAREQTSYAFVQAFTMAKRLAIQAIWDGAIFDPELRQRRDSGRLRLSVQSARAS
jgi:hypothetical protein